MKLLITTIFLISTLFGLEISYDTFQAKFTQQITDEENNTISYSGNIYATNKNTLVWQYKEPVIKTIYYIDNKVIIIEPELEQVIYTSIKSVPTLQNILKNALFIKDNKYQTKFKDKIINFNVDENKTLSSMNYKDEINNLVEIRFLNQLVNEKIDPKIYDLSFAKDYDIIN